MVQEAEERRRAFNAMLEETMAEADRLGTVSVEEAQAEAFKIIDDIERRQS
jgi:hypothetical protein